MTQAQSSTIQRVRIVPIPASGVDVVKVIAQPGIAGSTLPAVQAVTVFMPGLPGIQGPPGPGLEALEQEWVVTATGAQQIDLAAPILAILGFYVDGLKQKSSVYSFAGKTLSIQDIGLVVGSDILVSYTIALGE